ncbi:MAG TPA: hypothetical protein VHV75_10505 [Solirubrobacteraceae bacterium]|nr:hypothetical protein [Solirubrobacteraceae bacterium]
MARPSADRLFDASELKARIGGARLEVTLTDPHPDAAQTLEQFAAGH